MRRLQEYLNTPCQGDRKCTFIKITSSKTKEIGMANGLPVLEIQIFSEKINKHTYGHLTHIPKELMINISLSGL